MTSKIIINKYEEGRDTQFMEITIHEEFTNGKSSRRTVYGPWVNGESIKKITQPRLIINEIDLFTKSELDLDSIAKSVIHNITQNEGENFNGLDTNSGTDKNNKNDLGNLDKKSKRKIDEISEFLSKRAEISRSNKEHANHDPLDQKLEKIRKNNEKIMANILILNKAVNYSRRKEIEESMSAKLALVSFVCDICGKSFTKSAAFQYHMRKHKTSEEGNKNASHVTKMGSLKGKKLWVCPNCYQVWPKESFIREHVQNSGCSNQPDRQGPIDIQEILQNAHKPHISLLVQCEFCQKLFPSVSKALKHQKGHSVDRSYECTECEEGFSNYAEASRHWAECARILEKYTFALCKCFACNVCHDKFHNLDSLYLHRYEYEHFLLKCSSTNEIEKDVIIIEDEDGDTSNIPSSQESVYLVYQCELCGFICRQISALLTHKEEGHTTRLCQLCGEISEDKISFVRHMDQHTQAERDSGKFIRTKKNIK